ncbi:type I restriction enzyme, S subunit [Kaistia soli DSM 19436]|uniref:Type I restriction enzyme, S subunit n=1 Tax=Kaistia soli DSM 19436 TaxID=1122133 RepID=A0A1M5DY09_9HYPH|nr:restriction endonuclease subunit S [Kaistia soli]SHF71692.1 type I restriction enzyme, S subunit [Kaistia soli DSM 19436]
MSLPKYESYKDSGVEWLGEVPSHWSTAGLRWLAVRYSGGTPDKGNPSYWSDGDIPWLNSGSVNQPLISKPSAYITEEAFSNSSAKWIPEGALLMALAGQGKTKATVAQLGFRSTCNQSMAAIVPGNKITARFLYWWLTSNYENIRNLSGGDLRDGLNLELLGSIPCPITEIREQTAIVAFLDRETAKIDALVEEQKRLIELLKEKRQAVISHAVTKGLDPNAMMKESGVEWLGEVPAHWNVRSFLSAFDVVYRYPTYFDIQYEDAGIIEIRGEAIGSNGEIITLNDQRYISKETSDRFPMTQMEEGDLVMSVRGTLGKVAKITKSYIGSNITANLLRLSPNRILFDSDFVRYTVNSLEFTEQLSMFSSQTTIRTVTIPQLNQIRIACPPLEEQAAIAEKLGRRIAKLDALSVEAQTLVQFLRQRRSALISSAVTGKIDVRGMSTIEVEAV